MSLPINDTCAIDQYGSPCQYDWAGSVIDGGCCVDQSCSVDCLLEDDSFNQSNLIMMAMLLVVMLMLFAFLTVKWRRQWEQRMLYAAMMQQDREIIMQSIIQSANGPINQSVDQDQIEMQRVDRLIEYEDHHLVNQLNQSVSQPIDRASSQPIVRSSSQSRFEPYSGNSFRLSEMSESHSLDSISQLHNQSINQSINQSVNQSINRSSVENSESLDLDVDSDSDDEHVRPATGNGPYQPIR